MKTQQYYSVNSSNSATMKPPHTSESEKRSEVMASTPLTLSEEYKSFTGTIFSKRACGQQHISLRTGIFVLQAHLTQSTSKTNHALVAELNDIQD